MIYYGNNKIASIYNGTNKIGSAFVGGEKVYSSSRVPSGYTEVEWIQSTGTQYIYLGAVPHNNITARMQYTQLPSKTNLGTVGGSSGSENNGRYALGVEITTANYGLLFGAKSNPSGVTADSNMHIYYTDVANDRKSASLYVDDDFIYTLNNGIVVSTCTDFYLFAYRGFSSVSKFNVRIAYFKIDNFGEYIPCLRNSDNKPGMWDTVSETFLTNSGTGEFIAGPEV